MMFTPWSFSPLVLRPALWLDASDASTLYTGASLAAADGAISEWRDKSGNARHATQATGVSQPLRKTAIQNGRDVVRFDGSNDHLALSSGLNLLRNVSGATCFAVVKWATNPTTAKTFLFFSDGVSGIAVRFLTGAGATPQKPRVLTRRLDSATASTATGSTSVTTTAYIQTAVANYSARTLDIFTNGTADGSTTSAFDAAGNTSDTDSLYGSIGGVGSSGLQFCDIDIAEIVMIPRAVTESERLAVESYLKTKWATP